MKMYREDIEKILIF